MAIFTKSVFYSILFIISGIISSSAQPFTFSGQVTNSRSKLPVAYATLYFSHSQSGTTADSSGRFKIFSNYRNDTLIVSSVGYVKLITMTNSQNRELNISLEPSDYELSEVKIVAGKNPADFLFKKIVEHKKENSKRALESYSYEAYNKLQFDMIDVSEKFQNKKILRPFSFVFEGLDSAGGHSQLPVFLSETVSDYYYRAQPKQEKEIILASKITGAKNQSMAQFTGSMYQEIDVYENIFSLFKTNFTSPLADNGLFCYKYYIIDSAQTENGKSYELKFKPRRPSENTFAGFFWVDSTSFAITEIEMTLSSKANLNFVKSVFIHQRFEKVRSQKFMLSVNEVTIAINLPNKNFNVLAQKYSSYKNIVVNDNTIHEKFGDKMTVRLEGKVLDKNEAYWETARHTPLTSSEEKTYAMMDSLLNSRAYKNYYSVFNTLGTGYLTKSLFEIGPFYNFYSKNNVEGTRYRFGLRTSNKFSTKLMLYGYGAYGSGDARWKYNAGFIYMLGKSPRQTVSADFIRDYEYGSDQFNELGSDNVFASFFRKDVPRKIVWMQGEKFIYEKEWASGFSNKIILQHRMLLPSWNYSFTPQNENEGLTNQPITLSEITYSARYAWQEKFYKGEFLRTSMGSKYPIVEMRYTRALKNVLGGTLSYQKLYVEVNDKINLKFFGRFEYNIAAGKTFGTLPYPALDVAHGNETYYWSNSSFNGMNDYEFVTDHYASIMLTQHFGTFPFRYVPLMRKLKWRSLVTARMLWGGMSAANISANSGNSIQFPSSVPYLEAGAGVENIFRFLRVDAFWRLTYRELPDATLFGVRASVQFGF